MRERAKFWLDRELGDLELLRATYVTHSFSRHAHEGFAIGVIEAGAESFYYRGTNHTAPAGSIVVINPGEVHTGHAAEGGSWTYRMLYPDAGLLRRAASEVAGGDASIPFFGEPVIRDRDLFLLLGELHRSLELPRSRLERESRLLWGLARLITRHAESRPSPRSVGGERRAVRLARDLLEEHYAESVSLESLSEVAGLSPFHLLRVFRDEVGMPPHTYQTQVRVRNAKSLLLADVPAAQTALESGFSDQSHLSRHFKRLVGVPPGQYALGARSDEHPQQ